MSENIVVCMKIRFVIIRGDEVAHLVKKQRPVLKKNQ